jgi:hypothetical protein
MITHAYSELYINDAQITVAHSFDYAVRALKMSLSEYVEKFLHFEYLHLLEIGNPHYVGGVSGCELALEVCGIQSDIPSPSYNPGKEYWIGWIAAYYQWYRNVSYKAIFEKFSLERFESAYLTFHEENKMRMVEYMDEVILGEKSNFGRKYNVRTNYSK